MTTTTAPEIVVVGGAGGGHALAGRLKRRRTVRTTEPADLCGRTEPFDLVAVGDAAAPAIAYAGEHPERVRRLVVIAGAWPEQLTGTPAPERSLVIWGAADHRLRPRVGEKIVSTLGRLVDPATVEMVTLPGVGHGVLETAGDRVAGIVDEFLR